MAGLLALLGLVVPVAIHLWNRRPGRTVQVGSVRWLAPTANRRLRNLQLEQVWLLLLRLAVLLLLALAVAEPFWQRYQADQQPRGLVLLAPEALRPEVLPALRPAVDSLRSQGYALRLFAPGFRAVSGQAWSSPDSLAQLAAPRLAGPPSAGISASQPMVPDDYWVRARQAADSFPGQPLRVVAATAYRHFSGPRPALPARLTWQPVPLPDSAVWVVGAALFGADTLQLLTGRSREEATTFRVIKRLVPRTAGPLSVAGLPQLQYQPSQAGKPATVQQTGQPAVPVLTNPLRVLLYTDASHAESGRYVRAALQAAAIGLAQPLELRSASPESSFTATPPDWLFWLSDKPAPASWQVQVKRGARLWQEAPSGVAVEAELNLTGLATASPVSLNRLDTTSTPTASTSVVWQDGTGRPVLTQRASGIGRLYQLHTRLQSTWSSLPESPALPELFLQVLRPVAPATYAHHDLRQLDASQLTGPPAADSISIQSSATASVKSTLSRSNSQEHHTTDLRPWAVLAALVLFGLERWLAGRRASVSSSTSTL